MSATVSKKPKRYTPGYDRLTVTEITLDNSYASGGEPVSPALLGLRHVDIAICNVVHGTESATYRAVTGYYKEGKLHLIDSATGKEVEATKDMSKVVVQVVAFGR